MVARSPAGRYTDGEGAHGLLRLLCGLTIIQNPAADAWRRCSVGTCERCGADAVDGRGVCRNCGWQAPNDGFDDSPSYGETRAADPALSPPATGRYPASGPGIDRASTIAAQATRADRTGPVSGGHTAAGRFCGVCGARITGSETFCGQCGSPVAPPSGPGGRPGSQPGPGGHYQVGGAAGWDDDDRNAYTEALPETPTMAAARNPYAADPYARSYAPQYGSRGAVEPQRGMTRSTRITLGVVFLAVSILLALGAIALIFLF
jgi:hypothetical protein